MMDKLQKVPSVIKRGSPAYKLLTDAGQREQITIQSFRDRAASNLNDLINADTNLKTIAEKIDTFSKELSGSKLPGQRIMKQEKLFEHFDKQIQKFLNSEESIQDLPRLELIAQFCQILCYKSSNIELVKSTIRFINAALENKNITKIVNATKQFLDFKKVQQDNHKIIECNKSLKQIAKKLEEAWKTPSSDKVVAFQALGGLLKDLYGVNTLEAVCNILTKSKATFSQELLNVVNSLKNNLHEKIQGLSPELQLQYTAIATEEISGIIKDTDTVPALKLTWNIISEVFCGTLDCLTNAKTKLSSEIGAKSISVCLSPDTKFDKNELAALEEIVSSNIQDNIFRDLLTQEFKLRDLKLKEKLQKKLQKKFGGEKVNILTASMRHPEAFKSIVKALKAKLPPNEVEELCQGGKINGKNIWDMSIDIDRKLFKFLKEQKIDYHKQMITGSQKQNKQQASEQQQKVENHATITTEEEKNNNENQDNHVVESSGNRSVNRSKIIFYTKNDIKPRIKNDTKPRIKTESSSPDSGLNTSSGSSGSSSSSKNEEKYERIGMKLGEKMQNGELPQSAPQKVCERIYKFLHNSEHIRSQTDILNCGLIKANATLYRDDDSTQLHPKTAAEKLQESVEYIRNKLGLLEAFNIKSRGNFYVLQSNSDLLRALFEGNATLDGGDHANLTKKNFTPYCANLKSTAQNDLLEILRGSDNSAVYCSQPPIYFISPTVSPEQFVNKVLPYMQVAGES